MMYYLPLVAAREEAACGGAGSEPVPATQPLDQRHEVGLQVLAGVLLSNRPGKHYFLNLISIHVWEQN